MGAASKKKTRTPTAAASPPEQAPSPGLWPQEFCRPAWAGLLAGIVVLAGAVLFALASADRLIWFKITVSWFLGLAQPASVSPSSFDAALVLWGGTVVLCSGLIHPSVGLIALALFRHWIDGYTFPTDNLYFSAGIFYLTALWALRMLAGIDRPRHILPNLLLLLFLLGGIATSFSSIQLDRTYRELLYWATYLALFFLTTNALRSRRSFGILIAGLSVAMAMQTIFSILHFYYLLPTLRDMLMQSPELRKNYFGVDEFTPELVRRFNINRAFGSLLFPNGLAAFLILGLPFSLAGAALGWRSISAMWLSSREAARMEAAASRRYRAMALAVVSWFAGTIAFFAMAVFAIANRNPEATFETIMYGVGGGAMMAALAPAAFVFLIAESRGIVATGRALQAVGLTLLSALQCWALLLTYSRGGMLALLAAMLAGLFLLIRPVRFLPSGWTKGLAAALALLLALGLVAAMLPGLSWAATDDLPAAVAEESTPAAASDPISGELRTEGVSIGIQEMIDPASFRIRTTYWRVAFIMFRHHWLRGVGLGNFGLAYPQYQYLGAGDVRLAHNSFLQFFCETGLIGGLFFLGFWVFFFVWGARAIYRTADPWHRLIRAGLYTGVLAFCLHAAIDINFSHPSLVFYVMLYAGLFLVHARFPAESCDARPETPRAIYQLLGLPVLIALALTLGFGFRVYLHDVALIRVRVLNISDNDIKETMRKRLSIGRALLDNHRTALDPSLRNLQIYVSNVRMFIDDSQQLSEMGTLFVPMPDTPRGARRLEPGDAIPDEAILMINKPWVAFNYTREGIDRILAELERIDRRYPHDPELAIHIADWYQLLLDMIHGEEHAELRRGYWERQTRWAKEAVRRSPAHADTHLFCANQLWARALHSDIPDPEEMLLESLDYYRTALRLSPNSPGYYFALSRGLRSLGNAYYRAGRSEEGAMFHGRGVAVQKRGEDLRQRRFSMGLS